MYEPRLYRKIPENDRFSRIEVSYLETDLWIAYCLDISEILLQKFVLDTIFSLRNDLQLYQQRHPVFFTSQRALSKDDHAPEIIQKMLNAGIIANVGPMASVAGAFAEEIGVRIKKEFNPRELIIENGGDIFIDIEDPVLISIYAGKSPLSNKIALQITPEESPLGICTSSGKVGYSLSYGNADAVMISCNDTAEADAFATAIGNRVKSRLDIDRIIAETQMLKSVLAAVIIIDDKIGIQGNYDIQVLK